MILLKTENGKISTFPDRFCTELPYLSIPFEESFDTLLVEWLFYQNINKPVFTSEMGIKYDWELSNLSDGRDIFYTKVVPQRPKNRIGEADSWVKTNEDFAKFLTSVRFNL